VTRYSGKR
jgi:hypothetical protein